jgi:hypothetical protein
MSADVYRNARRPGQPKGEVRLRPASPVLVAKSAHPDARCQLDDVTGFVQTTAAADPGSAWSRLHQVCHLASDSPGEHRSGVSLLV